MLVLRDAEGRMKKDQEGCKEEKSRVFHDSSLVAIQWAIMAL